MGDAGYDIGMMAAALRGMPSSVAPELIEALEFSLQPAKQVWTLVKMIWEAQDVGKKLPTLNELRHMVLSAQGHDPLHQGLVLKFLDHVEQADYTGYTRGNIIKHAARQRAGRVAGAIQEAVGQGKDISDMVRHWVAALQEAVVVESSVGWVDLGDSIALQKMEEERIAKLQGLRVIPSTILRFDVRCIYGGFLPGDFAIILGPTGRGKTVVMASWTRRWASVRNLACAYIPVEDTPHNILARYEAGITHIPSGDPQTTRDDWRQRFDIALRSKDNCYASGGRLFLPNRSVPKPWRAAMLKPMIEKIEAEYNRRIDVVVVDHLDVIEARKEYRGKEHIQYKEITDELSAYAQDNLKLVVTATQGNRQGYGAEIPTLVHVAEGFNKAWAATQFFSIGMTPAQKNLGEFGLAVLKNRHARGGQSDYVIPMRINFEQQEVSEMTGSEVYDIKEYVKKVQGE
jgi:hypothetical protein